MSSLKNPNEVFEVRMGRDGKITSYTAQNFYDDVMRDKTRVQVAKFYHITDDWQPDTIDDAHVKRRGKRYSISRDSLDGPLRAGRIGLPAFDPHRFRDEADKLTRLGIVKRQIDWHDDESIKQFFGAVQQALNNATPNQARDVASAGPSIFLFTELMKRTEKLVAEQITKLWARTVFPIRNLNTWLPTWNYTRESEREGPLPQYTDFDEVPGNIPRRSERRRPIVRPLVFFDEGASWTQHELWVMAEAVANGAHAYQVDTRRPERAQRNLLFKENILAFFGDDEVDIHGLLSAAADTGIERVPSPTQFGSGTAEADRHLLIDTALKIVDETDDELRPNMIGLPNKPFLHCISRRYGTPDNPSDQTVAEAALATLSQIGINTLTQIPELGYRVKLRDRLIKRGIASAEATRLAGGVDVSGTQKDVMMVARRDPEVMEMILAKDITPYPAAETVRGKTEMRWALGSGGLEVYQPEGVKLVTDVTGANTMFYEDPE